MKEEKKEMKNVEKEAIHSSETLDKEAVDTIFRLYDKTFKGLVNR